MPLLLLPIWSWRFLLVPVVLALFGLRFSRGRLPRERLWYGIAAIALWGSFEVVRLARAFAHPSMDVHVVLFALFIGAIPTIAAGLAGLIVGRFGRLNVWAACIVVLILAYASTVVSSIIALQFVDLVNAVG